MVLFFKSVPGIYVYTVRRSFAFWHCRTWFVLASAQFLLRPNFAKTRQVCISDFGFFEVFRILYARRFSIVFARVPMGYIVVILAVDGNVRSVRAKL